MSDNRKKPRIYNWVIKSNSVTNTTECKNFRSYVQDLVKRANKLLEYDTNRFQEDCFIYIKMECYPTGSCSPNRMKRDLLRNYPDADAEEIKRNR